MADTQIRLCSMWAYTEDGARHVIESLQKLNLPGASYVYEPDEAWFKVTCFDEHCTSIEKEFYEIQSSIEARVSEYAGTDELGGSLDLELIQPHVFRFQSQRAVIQSDDGATEVTPIMTSASTGNRIVREWTKLADKDQHVAFDRVLSEFKLLSIQTDSGAILRWNANTRVVTIAAESEAVVDTAQRKLDVVLEDMCQKRPELQHLLYADCDETFYVDARLMRHINPAMLTSTIVIPSKLPLLQQYRRIYDGASSLRICLEKMSMFGPRPQGVFDRERGRAAFTAFSSYIYPSKEPDAPAIPQPAAAASSTPTIERLDKKGQVQAWINRMPERKSMAAASQPCSVPSGPTTASPSVNGDESQRDTAEDRPISIPTSTSRQGVYQESQPLVVHGDQARLLSNEELRQSREVIDRQLASRQLKSQQINDAGGDTAYQQMPDIIGDAGSKLQIAQSIKANLEAKDISTRFSEPNDAEGEGDLIDLDDSGATIQQATASNVEPEVPEPLATPQVQFQDELSSREFHVTMNQRAPKKSGNSPGTRQTPELTFSGLAREKLFPLVEGLRSKVGKVKLKAEVGRIYLIDLAASALATNKRNEPADPWKSEHLMRKLHGLGINHIFFTKALSNFGNDADFLINLKQASLDTNMWVRDHRYVVYEFRCTHLRQKRDFVVEVHGESFKWRIRSTTDDSSLVYVHCLQTQWDFRLVVDFIPTDELKTEYGAFAEKLVASLTIPKNSREAAVAVMWDETRRSQATVNQVRVHQVARCRSRDKITFLDVVQVQEMEIEGRQDGDIFRFKAVPKLVREVTDGHFPVWYEAFVSSAKAEELFEQNESLKHGEKTQWTLETFKQNNIIDGLVDRATTVVKKIDGVGVFCNNGLGNQYGLQVDESSGAIVPSATAETKEWYDREAWFF